jgi:hypothetical protein
MVPYRRDAMRTHSNVPNPRLMHFVSLREASKALGARSRKEFLKDFRTLTGKERAEIAALIARKEG